MTRAPPRPDAVAPTIAPKGNVIEEMRVTRVRQRGDAQTPATAQRANAIEEMRVTRARQRVDAAAPITVSVGLVFTEALLMTMRISPMILLGR